MGEELVGLGFFPQAPATIASRSVGVSARHPPQTFRLGNGDRIDHGLHRLHGWRKLERPMREETLTRRVNAPLAASLCISVSSPPKDGPVLWHGASSVPARGRVCSRQRTGLSFGMTSAWVSIPGLGLVPLSQTTDMFSTIWRRVRKPPKPVILSRGRRRGRHGVEESRRHELNVQQAFHGILRLRSSPPAPARNSAANEPAGFPETFGLAGRAGSGDIPLRRAQSLEPVETAVADPECDGGAHAFGKVAGATCAHRGDWALHAWCSSATFPFDGLRALSLSKGDVAAPWAPPVHPAP